MRGFTMTSKRHEDDDRLVEQIYDALDAGTPDRALAAARIALHDAPDDPVLHFLAGIALVEMDLPGEAIAEFDHAIASDPDDPEFLAARSRARFATCRFKDAKSDAEHAISVEPDCAEALCVLAL